MTKVDLILRKQSLNHLSIATIQMERADKDEENMLGKKERIEEKSAES